MVLLAAAVAVALLVIGAVAGVHTCCIPCYVSGRSVSRKSETLNGAFVPSAGTPPQLNAALCAERSKQSYEAPLCECQTELNKTTMSTSSYRRGVYRGALAAAGSCPALAACGHRDPDWVVR